MDSRKISQLAPYLKENNLLPKRSLSQNFLIDQNILDRLCSVAEIQEGEAVLEIGAGVGGITQTLLDRGAHVFAVEIDQRYIPTLEGLHPQNKLNIIHKDFLKLSFSDDLEGLSLPTKVIGNIPFHITAPIVEHLANNRSSLTTVFLIVQKDVASRMRSSHDCKTYGSFSIFCQYYFEIKELLTIKPGSFYPKPAINSSYISLTPRQDHPLADPAPFFAFVRHLFSQRRKMIGPRIDHPKSKEALAKNNLSGKERPENLTLEMFLDLYRKLYLEA